MDGVQLVKSSEMKWMLGNKGIVTNTVGILKQEICKYSFRSDKDTTSKKLFFPDLKLF